MSGNTGNHSNNIKIIHIYWVLTMHSALRCFVYIVSQNPYSNTEIGIIHVLTLQWGNWGTGMFSWSGKIAELASDRGRISTQKVRWRACNTFYLHTLEGRWLRHLGFTKCIFSLEVGETGRSGSPFSKMWKFWQEAHWKLALGEL